LRQQLHQLEQGVPCGHAERFACRACRTPGAISPSGRIEPIDVLAGAHASRGNVVGTFRRRDGARDSAVPDWQEAHPALGPAAVPMRVLPIIAALLVAASSAAAADLVGSPRIVDGDTLEVAGTKIRLYGIDAPELHQECRRSGGTVTLLYHCGRDAKAALGRIIGAGTVTCRGKDRDRYGRIVATCSAAGRDIGREMVREGWAVAYTRYSRAYVPDESAAKVAHAGLWSGEFEMPAEWRARHRH
jgi:endonuclease YncB( thermonuclease family)